MLANEKQLVEPGKNVKIQENFRKCFGAVLVLDCNDNHGGIFNRLKKFQYRIEPIQENLSTVTTEKSFKFYFEPF